MRGNYVFLKSAPSVEESFRACEEIAFRHYENFPVASIFIPRKKRKYVAAIYTFARTADDFADEEGYTASTRIEKLTELERKLHESADGSVRDPLFIALGDTVRRFDLPVECFENLLMAFRMDVEKKRYANWTELLQYCSYSANPIGRLMLRLFGYARDEHLRASDSICTALQLTNFWQDLSIDARKDRIYLPLEDLKNFDCTEEDILKGRVHDKFRRLMAHEVDKTVALFDGGKGILKSIGRDLRFQLTLTWLGGMKILDKIRSSNYNVFEDRPTISARDKASLVMGAWLGRVS